MSDNERAILVATSNPGKAAVLQRRLPDDVRVLTLRDIVFTSPAETGATFEENARLKALAAANATGMLTVADDSGLEVDALGGEPGVRSARYAGEPSDDARNRRKLLEAMNGIPWPQRTAQFRCVVALARPNQVLATAEGTCAGHITTAERGTNGFGYDPIFQYADGRTLAEMSDAEKDWISHRGKAMAALLPTLRREIERGASSSAFAHRPVEKGGRTQ
jgi:XTP/dITP diphosphohydrolase